MSKERDMAARANDSRHSRAELTEQNETLRKKLETNARDRIVEDPQCEMRDEFIKLLQERLLLDGTTLQPNEVLRFTAWERLNLIPMCTTKSGRETLLRSLDDVAKEELKRQAKVELQEREVRDRDIRLEELAVRRLEAENTKERLEDDRTKAERWLQMQRERASAPDVTESPPSEAEVAAVEEEAQALAEIEERELRRAAGLE